MIYSLALLSLQQEYKEINTCDMKLKTENEYLFL